MEGVRTLAFRRLSPLNAAVPPSPSWGSVDSSGRRHHGNISPTISSPNLSNRETSSGEYTVRSASLATPQPEQELGSVSREDLSCIYAEDLMEEGVTNSVALRLLQGFETFGVIRSFGSVGPRPGRKRRAQPHQHNGTEPTGSSATGGNDTPAQPTTFEWRQPKPFHEVFSQGSQ